MKIVFLGTGGTYPSKIRNVSSLAVQVGPDVVMFDCGEGTQRQLMHSPVSFMRIRAIFISHLHADHFLGLAGLIQSMSLNGRTERLLVFGPRGTKDTVTAMLDLGYFKSQFDVDAKDIGSGASVDFDAFAVETVRSSHTIPSLAYAIQEKSRPGRFNLERAKSLGVPEGPMYRALQEGSSVTVDGKVVVPGDVMGKERPGLRMVYSGDTRPCEAVAKLATGADALVHDSTLDSSHSELAAEFGHSTAAEAAELAKAANVKRLYLVHISPRYDDCKALEAEARRIFPDSIVANDLDVVEIRYR
ncbi:MAG: ribonuclease Z [Thermoplasmata archaeon]|nr:ribonuclease Z [Thermoplasmata archaeon]